ncbi:MAG: phenylacetate-CoA oxygenase subunit PaaJ [Kineosporiaceae bacterium]|nr:phenylacetate-CoA oxygenase subunit PaaJ [Kineosporiaceae bacterium]
MVTVDTATLLAAAREVPDPEIPVITLGDLGVVRDLRLDQAGTVHVDVTPTYVGCPATAVIAQDVAAAVRAAGAPRVEVHTVLSPAWTTDWISEEGRTKLREYGIAPPGPVVPPGPARPARDGAIPLPVVPRCPRCGSADTREVTRFGSTPCKALLTCQSCAEPFDSFKAI